MNFSFVDAEWEQDFAGNDNPVKLLNPIASQLSVMRTTLFGSLISVLRYNLNRRADRIRVFEAGRVFLHDPSIKAGELTIEGFAQPKMIGGLAYGPTLDEQWGAPSRTVDFFDVKGDVEALLRAGRAAFRDGSSIRRCIRDAARGLKSMVARSAGLASFIRAGCKSMICRRRRFCSKSKPTR